MSFDAYLAAQEANIATIRSLRQFTGLVLPVNELYERGIRLIPHQSNTYLARMMLLCHKSLLSAAALLVRALPDDAAAITRRAIEIARTALAVKHDPENLKRWLNFEARMARWEARNRGERTKHLHSGVVYPKHPIVEDLGRQLGILSDAAVHFTPEFLDNQSWRIERTEIGGSVFLGYFAQDQRTIETHLYLLAAVHLQSLELFNECFAGAFQRDAAWVQIAQKVKATGQELALGQKAPEEEQP